MSRIPAAPAPCRRQASLSGPAARQQAFTVVELLVVIAFIFILLAVGGPSLAGWLARVRVEGIGNELNADLAYARSEAIQRNAPVGISFDADADKTCYVIHTLGPGGCQCLNAGTANPVCTGGRVEIKTVQVETASTVTLAASSSGGTGVEFDPQRGMASVPDLSIEVVSSLGGHLSARLNAMGRVRLCSPDRSIRSVQDAC